MSADASDPIWGSLLLQAFFILISAFFAAAHAALLSLNEGQLKRKADEGDKRSARMLRMVQAPDPFLSTLRALLKLLGFLASAFAAGRFAGALSNTLFGWGVTFLSEKTLGRACVVVVTLIFAYFMLVFGEFVPQRIAKQHADRVARLTSGIVRRLSWLMRPVVWLLFVSTNLVLRLLGVSTEGGDADVTEEGIRMMVDIGEEKGTIEAREAEMIENIFEFNNLTAEEVMVHRLDVSAFSSADTEEEILSTILETGFSRFPVYEEDIDDIIGILNTRAYLLNAQKDAPLPLGELIRPAYFVPEGVRADVLFRDMQKKKVHMAIVVDEYGGTSGIVTMEDLLEEIVGDIYDEYDPQDEQEIVQLEPNLWRASGMVDLETLGEALDMDLPQNEEFDTLGGLVYSRMTEIPSDGARPLVSAHGLRIQIERLEGRRVESALISKEEGPQALTQSKE